MAVILDCIVHPPLPAARAASGQAAAAPPNSVKNSPPRRRALVIRRFPAAGMHHGAASVSPRSCSRISLIERDASLFDHGPPFFHFGRKQSGQFFRRRANGHHADVVEVCLDRWIAQSGDRVNGGPFMTLADDRRSSLLRCRTGLFFQRCGRVRSSAREEQCGGESFTLLGGAAAAWSLAARAAGSGGCTIQSRMTANVQSHPDSHRIVCQRA